MPFPFSRNDGGQLRQGDAFPPHNDRLMDDLIHKVRLTAPLRSVND